MTMPSYTFNQMSWLQKQIVTISKRVTMNFTIDDFWHKI